MVAVYPGLPAHSIKELIALAKQQPGALQYGSSGIGTFVHLGGELFKMAAGIDMLHVPFKGTAPAMIDLMAGNTKVTFGSHHVDHAASCAAAGFARSRWVAR